MIAICGAIPVQGRVCLCAVGDEPEDRTWQMPLSRMFEIIKSQNAPQPTWHTTHGVRNTGGIGQFASGSTRVTIHIGSRDRHASCSSGWPALFSGTDRYTAFSYALKATGSAAI